MLPVGAAIPAFKLPCSDGTVVTAKSLRGQRYVLFLYPKDSTPTCTVEACAFRDEQPAFAALGVPVYGVSADSLKSHARFIDKYGLSFPLLADEDRSQLIEPLGAWVQKQLYGRDYMGILRCTVVVDAKGRIAMTWDKVKSATHAAEVRAWLEGSKGRRASPK